MGEEKNQIIIIRPPRKKLTKEEVKERMKKLPERMEKILANLAKNKN